MRNASKPCKTYRSAISNRPTQRCERGPTKRGLGSNKSLAGLVHQSYPKFGILLLAIEGCTREPRDSSYEAAHHHVSSFEQSPNPRLDCCVLSFEVTAGGCPDSRAVFL